MEINEEILERFLAGECKQEEEAFVLRALQDNPDLIDQYFQQHTSSLANQDINNIPKDISDRLFNQIYTAIEEKRKRKSQLLVRISSIAALMVLSFGFWRIAVFNGTNSQSAPLVTTAKIVKINTSDTIQHWILPDSSVVKAAPKAVLSYSNNFDKFRRDVYLTGQAEFDIRHNAQKPFSVFSNKISTLVLGTKFSVNANQKQIEVKLLEGKVMVKKISGSTLRPIYLNPGNAVVYTISTGRFLAISNFNKAKRRITPHFASRPLNSNKNSNETIAFNNTSMEYAIDKLAEQYEVEIQYSPIDIMGINLIAKISKKRPVKKILEDIAITNGLTVKENEKSVFILEKKQTRPE